MRLFHAFERIIYPLVYLNFRGFLKYHRKNADIVVISSLLTNKKFSSELIAWEVGFLNGLIKNKINFTFRKLKGDLFDKQILWSPSKEFDVIKFRNYPYSLFFYAKQLELQNNQVFISSDEVMYLENKYYMHSKFSENSIRTPETWYYNKISDIIFEDLKFPLLYKGVHSAGSLDIIKFENLEALKNFLTQKDSETHNVQIVLQKLLNMRRDMRVTVLGNKILYSFWRINPNKEWMTTASKNGSIIKFEEVPEKWRSMIIAVVQKLKLDICGLDIAFENDDISTEPYILEVSPRFSQNPPYEKDPDVEYRKYKQKTFIKNSFRNNQTKIHIKIASDYVDYLIENKKLSPNVLKNTKLLLH
jgi:glutathione synthase/RimK-type ligase-like ATP-grasp enzyme